MSIPAPTFKELLSQLEDALVQPTSLAASLPDAQDLGFERSLSRPLARQLDKEADRVLQLVSNVLNWSSPATNARLASIDGDLIKDGEYRQVIERVETLLEGADESIETHLGVGKAKKTVGAAGALSAEELLQRDQKAAAAHKGRLPANLLHDASLARPQLLFPSRLTIPIPNIDADADVEPLWKPVLRRKPHALSAAHTEADSWLVREMHAPSDRFTPITSTAPPPYLRYAHPYAKELESLSPPASLLARPEQPPTPASDSFEKTAFSWVGDKIALKTMVKEIRAVGEDEAKRDLAVDLEHHDYRSWSGFTSLMQMSTRHKDYVIDVLDPGVRDEIEILNEFFADSSWVKVFHGARSDIIWLQRDLGLYVVGLFDTYHATNVLGFAQHSLASLLAMYTDFEPDKRYQLADWRIRPLNKEMLHYARSDTHYLLDIYDHLRLALLDKEIERAPDAGDQPESSPLEDVYYRSRDTSASVFSIPPYDAATGHHEGGWLPLLGSNQSLKSYATALAVPTLPIKTGWGPGESKLEVLKAVHYWRERLAREEDESQRFVLSNDGLWSIAQAAPTDGAALMKVLGGARGSVSEIVRKRKEELSSVVKEALERCGGVKMETSEGTAIVRGGLESSLGGVAAEEPEVRPLPGLWDQRAALSVLPSNLAASTSSFFGNLGGDPATTAAVPVEVASAGGRGLVASISSFFGGSKSKALPAANKTKGKQVQDTRSMRDERVAKIHASLVLGGGLASTLRGQAVPAVEATQPSEEAPAVAMEDVDQVNEADKHASALTGDHTYVPLSARVPKQAQATLDAASTTPIAPAPSDKDVIVVSTMADKPKKRRRNVAATTAATGAATGLDSSSSAVSPAKKKKVDKDKIKKANVKSEPVDPHDYSTSKSILDAEPQSGLGDDAAGGKKKKRRDQVGRAAKGFTIDTSAFRREPRVNNAPKKGAISKTFV